MNKFTIFLIAIILQLQAILAQEIPDDQVPKLPVINAKTLSSIDDADIINNLKKVFSKITSFEYVSQQNTPKDPYYGRLDWKEMGDKYIYDFSADDKNRKHQIHEMVSFDGKRSYYFNTASGQIKIKNGQLDMLDVEGFDSPLSLFSFLQADEKALTMRDLSSISSLWQKAQSRMSYAGIGNFMDRDCLIIRFSKSFNLELGEKADYDVYFDHKSLLPIGWRAYDSNGAIIQQLEAIETKTIIGEDGVSFTYPDHYRLTQYQWQATITTSGRVVKYYKDARDIYFKEVLINHVSPESLEIDPGLASSIYDMDSENLITIPK